MTPERLAEIVAQRTVLTSSTADRLADPVVEEFAAALREAWRERDRLWQAVQQHTEERVELIRERDAARAALRELISMIEEAAAGDHLSRLAYNVLAPACERFRATLGEGA